MSIDLAYAELGLVPGASEAEVRAAWRRLVSRWHPDRNASPDAVGLMQRINRAYETIRVTAFSPVGDAESAANEASPTEAPTEAPPEPPANAPADEPVRQPSIRRRVRLTLEEAALGCTKVLRSKVTCACAVCADAGVIEPPAPCPDCGGTGTVRSGVWFGWLSTPSRCAACDGHGLVNARCGACAGTGEQSTTHRRKVRIPAGVRDGDVLGRGDVDVDVDVEFVDRDAAASGQKSTGDLELHVKVSRHELFEVDERTLRCTMPVDGFQWIANAWIDVPTLTGLKQMRLQRGRHLYRLRGEGLPLQRGGTARGDYLVTVEPAFAPELSAQQEALLAKMARASAKDETSVAEPLRDWRRALDDWQSRSGREASPQTDTKARRANQM